MRINNVIRAEKSTILLKILLITEEVEISRPELMQSDSPENDRNYGDIDKNVNQPY